MWITSGILGDLLRVKQYTIARNPWLHPNRYKIAVKYGFNVEKSALIYRRTPPWSKGWGHYSGASDAQLEIWEKFTETVKRERGKKGIIPVAVQKVMTGYTAVSAKAPPRPYTSEITLEKIRRERERRRIGPPVRVAEVVPPGRVPAPE